MYDHETSETIDVKTIEVELSNPALASKLLAEQMIDVKVTASKGNRMTLAARKEQIPSVNKLFVENDIDVYEILNVKATLEDRFLEITNKDKKEQTV